MPGAPNRPPEPDAPAAPPPPVVGTPSQKVLRRLTPSRIALRLDVWKGGPSPELLKPLDRAEATFLAGDFPNAEGALDQLAVRFAEPRWPTLPKPFRELRQDIPAPQPPGWDPENAYPAAQKEARKAWRQAELQLRLVDASLEWAGTHGSDVADLAPHAADARTRFGSEGASEAFWTHVDAIWSALRERVAKPAPAPSRAPAAPAAAEAEPVP
jgi:hypothetical protein